MANVWGIALNPYVPVSYATVSGSDVTLTAGSEVTAITTGTIVANEAGDYYPLIFGALNITLGASASASLVIAFKIGSGSDVATLTVNTGLLVNSAVFIVPFCFVGANSGSAWYPNGSTINITGHATTHNATANNVGSYAIVQLIQGQNM